MKKSITNIISVLLGTYMLTACVSCNEEKETVVPTFANPIYSLTAGYGSTRVGEADPWVYRHSDGYYYYTASYGSTFNQIQIKRAKTIDLLDSSSDAEVATIITPGAGNFASIQTYLWAPELHYIDGNWYLFFTATCNETGNPAYRTSEWAVKNYVAKCTDDDPLTGTWDLCGRVRAVKGKVFDETALDDTSNADKMDLTLYQKAGDTGPYAWMMNLDGTAFKVKGQWYYAWAQNVYDGSWADEGEAGDTVLTVGGIDHISGTGNNGWSSILIGKVVEGSDFTQITETRVISAPRYTWEWGEEVYDEKGRVNSFEDTIARSPTVNVNEGPAILMRNGKIFLVYSASACDATYCLGMLTADIDSDLLDVNSWSKSEKPVFTTSVRNSVYGPGHCSFTTYKGYDVIVYHARQWPKLYSFYGRNNNYTVATEGLQDPYRTGRAKVFTWNSDGTPNFGEAE